MKEGDVIVVIGRRRRAAYARVHIHKQKKTSCTVEENLAANLRLRTGDKIKVSSLTSVDDEEHKTGDMILFQSSPKSVTSVTYSPLEDSLQNLESSEGELSDDEITARFITPYLNLEASESGVLVKKGHVVKMTDDNGKHLECMVTHVELEGAEQEDEEEEGTHLRMHVMMIIWNGC
jgi:hypothetical protein